MAPEIDPSLKKDYEFFQGVKEELLEKHAGKYALVKEGKVIGTFDTQPAAYEEGVGRFGNVAFLIALIQSEESVVWIPSLQLGLLNARI